MNIWKGIKAVAFLSFATLLIIFFDTFLEEIDYVVGGLMALYGAERIVMLLINKVRLLEDADFLTGIFEVVIGNVMILSPNMTFEAACAIWAVWTILRESREICEALRSFETKIPSIIDVVESGVSIVVSLMLLINPSPTEVRLHLVLLIVELVFTSLLPYVYRAAEKARAKRLQRKSAVATAPQK